MSERVCEREVRESEREREKREREGKVREGDRVRRSICPGTIVSSDSHCHRFSTPVALPPIVPHFFIRHDARQILYMVDF